MRRQQVRVLLAPWFRWKVPFRVALLTLVLGSLLLTTGGIGLIAYRNSREALEDIKEKHHRLTSQAMASEIHRLIDPAQRILMEYQALAARSLLPLDDSDALGLRFAEALRARHFLGWLSYSDAATGRFVGAWRQNGGAIVVNQSAPAVDEGRPREAIIHPDGTRQPIDRGLPAHYDPRTKPWFQRAMAAPGLVWSEPYLFNEGETGVTASLACRLPGRDAAEGVFTADFFLAGISRYLRTITRDRRSLAVVLSPSGEIVGSSSSLAGDHDAVFRAARAALPVRLEQIPPGEPVRFRVGVHGEKYDAIFTAFTLGSGFGYVFGIIGDESEFLGVAGRNARLTFLIALGATVFAASLAMLLAGRISRPLRQISADLQQVGKFQLRSQRRPSSRVREIDVMWESVERMKSGLRSFGRYVPVALVHELLSQGLDASLGAGNKPLTLFFSDIEGFTRISEKFTPEQVFAELSDYLELTTEIIVSTSGTIDKYMGDGVLAFYNAPGDVPDHASQACRAALEVQRRLALVAPEREKEGRPVFRARIGLHTSQVLVGNIGTSERFSYSVLGDGVNLASRLENLNKIYGTRILASEATFREAGAEFEWRMIDYLAVLGRTGGTLVFELLGERRELTSDLLRARDAYEEGLQCLLRHDFGKAVAHFQTAHELQPQDVAASVMLARATDLVSNPPDPKVAPLHWRQIRSGAPADTRQEP